MRLRVRLGAVSTDLQRETTDVLQRLVRFNTVNPPGDERAAQEFLAGYLRGRGLRGRAARGRAGAPEPDRDARRRRSGRARHCSTSAMSTRCWPIRPSGRTTPGRATSSDGFLWGRGAIDMKSQVAAEATAAASLARDGWRPSHGRLKLVFVVDEETGGEFGAQWLTSNHPDKVRCDMLINEGGGAVFDYGDRRLYGVCCGEKGVFRFSITPPASRAMRRCRGWATTRCSSSARCSRGWLPSSHPLT